MKKLLQLLVPGNISHEQMQAIRQQWQMISEGTDYGESKILILPAGMEVKPIIGAGMENVIDHLRNSGRDDLADGLLREMTNAERTEDIQTETPATAEADRHP